MTHKRLQSGFTLIELLVSMVITVVLLGVLVYMTGISMDTYKKSRNEVRASRQAKEALDTIANAARISMGCEEKCPGAQLTRAAGRLMTCMPSIVSRSC